MSDENKPGDGSAPPVDEIKNLKAEFARKFENTNAQLQEVLNTLKSQAKPAAPAKDDSEDLEAQLYSNPKAFVENVTNKVRAEVSKEVNMSQAKQAKFQQTVNAILQEFPEAANESSPLMQRAREIFGTLAEEDRQSPLAMKSAVAEAAAEIGLKPKSKREASADEAFSLGSGSGSRAEGSSRRQKSGELDERTKMFALAVGLDLDSPKNKESAERIKGKHGRKSYEKWG